MAGCASAPTVGVRQAHKTTRVAVITIAPPYSTSHFGLSDDEWRHLERIAVDEMADALVGLGFQVVTPDALRDQLERTGGWQPFVQLLEFDDGLDNRFEPSLYAPSSAEIAELQRLSADGVVGEDPILFVEIVYHSAGQCQLDAREYNRFAIVVTTDNKPIDTVTPSRCVVTHLQAKLVSPVTAATIWHNRVLREMHGNTVTVAHSLENIAVAVRELVRSAHGLAPLAPDNNDIAALR